MQSNGEGLNSSYMSEEQKQKQKSRPTLEENDLVIHDQFMDSLIKKYRPVRKTNIFDPANITKEGLREVGLEKIAKDLL